MSPSWTIRVPLLPNELFSTWLARAALAQGCDPMDLTGSLWPGWRAWTRDLDRGLDPGRLNLLAARSGISAAQLEEATLRPIISLIAPGCGTAQSMWPWMLSLGSRNRRRFGGLQYCPSCLSEDSNPYFRRAWRLAWHVGCTRHGNLLADHCSHCLAPVEPHRCKAIDRTLCCCPSCGHDLRNCTTESACADALAFQAIADDVLQRGHGIWFDKVLEVSEWFGVARVHASGPIRVREGDRSPLALTSLSLNLQRPSERALRLRMAYRGMHGQSMGVPLRASCYLGLETATRVRGASKRRERGGNSAFPRPQIKVQDEWIRLLRRMRVGHP